jgi:ATP-dependent DNA helicase RecG
MVKKKIFISSVQREFEAERKALYEYIYADPLLGRFFEPFIFEALPAIDRRVDKVYLNEVKNCAIYIGLFGKEYGYENSDGTSPTEMEFDQATNYHLTRFIFLSSHPNIERHPKQLSLIDRAQGVVVRRSFTGIDDLISSVYATLVRYLEEKEVIRTGPFDASVTEKAIIADINRENLIEFVRLAKFKRGFPLKETESTEKMLTHLNLLSNGKPTNAALLLFSEDPQRFFISSEVRCVMFRGIIVEKPIPSYKVFKGTVFELVDQTVEFILSKLDYGIGTRAEHIRIPGGYEIPKEVVTEAVVNAIAHRDYTCNGSVQVMIFRDRIEIWNPGSLPLGWTTEKLKHLHTSIPANPLLAEPMYLAGLIERLGTGTSDMVSKSLDAGLNEPEFIQAEEFRVILYRPEALKPRDVDSYQEYLKYTGTINELPQEFRSTSVEVQQLILILEGEMNRLKIQEKMGLIHEGNFRDNYLVPAIGEGLIEMKYPQKNHPRQQYRLTSKGLSLQLILRNMV